MRIACMPRCPRCLRPWITSDADPALPRLRPVNPAQRQRTPEKWLKLWLRAWEQIGKRVAARGTSAALPVRRRLDPGVRMLLGAAAALGAPYAR